MIFLATWIPLTIGKWAMELSEHVIDFEKRNADWTEPASYTEGPVIESPWQVYYDGAGAAAILISPSEIKLRYAAQLQFKK
jgi:hypothetical protein